MEMNAYKLADELDRIVKVSMPLHYITESANMLRQQADRIAELEDRLSMYEIKDLDRGIIGRTKDYVIHDLVHRTTPQIKELSDEEIEQIAVKWYVGTRILPIGFARAILKKASE